MNGSGHDRREHQAGIEDDDSSPASRNSPCRPREGGDAGRDETEPLLARAAPPGDDDSTEHGENSENSEHRATRTPEPRRRLLRFCTVRHARAMLLLSLLALAAALGTLQYRKEAALRAPWEPDAASLAFARRPLPPPLEGAQIGNFSLPLRTAGRHIVDATGRRFRLAAVNWYGASDVLLVPGGLDVRHRDEIARTIRRMGFNSVRLPYADEMVMADPVVDAEAVAANADLAGRRAMDVFEAVVAALTEAGLAVIVNDHITRATWCCGADPCDAAWTNAHLGPLCRVGLTEAQWVRNWEAVMARFVGNPLVVGADLRNEVRGLWGTMPWARWAAAAEMCGDRLLALDPGLLIVVEGTSSANDLAGVRRRPVRLAAADRLVYSAHVYGWSGWGSWAGRFTQRSYASFARSMRQSWGYLLEEAVAPVWVGELGAPASPNQGDARYWRHLWRYLKAVDADFGYWAVNTRKPGGNVVETYSIVEEDWTTPILDYRMKDMTEWIRREPDV